MTLQEITKRAVLKRIVLHDFRVVEAGQSLGVSKTTMYRWLREWGVESFGTDDILNSERERRKIAVLRILEAM